MDRTAIDLIPLLGQEIIFDYKNNLMFTRKRDPNLLWYIHQENEWEIRKSKGQILIIPHEARHHGILVPDLSSWHFFSLLTEPKKEPFQVLYIPRAKTNRIFFFKKGGGNNDPSLEELHQYWGEGNQMVGRKILESTLKTLRQFLSEPVKEYYKRIEELKRVQTPQN